MRELSLHVLDLVENSIRAGAREVRVTLAEDPARDTLELTVEDDGPGLAVPPEQALDPFYTTKQGKKTGLGLPLLRTTARQTGGELTLGRSPLGGLRVHAVLGREHVDRVPLGDLAATLGTLACTNPELELACRLQVGARAVEIRTSQVKEQLPDPDDVVVAQRLAERIRQGLSSIGAAS